MRENKNKEFLAEFTLDKFLFYQSCLGSLVVTATKFEKFILLGVLERQNKAPSPQIINIC